MTCEIGITPNRGETVTKLRSKHPNYEGWHLLDKGSTKSEAKKKAKQYAKEFGCETIEVDDGGKEDEMWFVHKIVY